MCTIHKINPVEFESGLGQTPSTINTQTMDENIKAALDLKDQVIGNYQTRIAYLESQHRQQVAYIALLEAALKQYNIILDIKESGISTRILQIK